MKKVGLLGGTFDPVHNGHVSIARSFFESSYIDELWIILTPYPPHKQKEHKVSFEHRLLMLNAAFQHDPVTIITVERDLPKPSYSYRTIQHLKKEHPKYEFFYCMGEDSLTNFHLWKYYELILEEVDLLVAHRPDSNHENVDLQILSQTTFVDHHPVDISSSDIKHKLHNNIEVEHLLPPKVLNIIDKENLYR